MKLESLSGKPGGLFYFFTYWQNWCTFLLFMPIDRLDFENISENDLKELLAAKVPEGLRIDYKRELYGHSDSDKREALKDVSSFANSFGGHLIIGVEEKAGLPLAIPGITGANKSIKIV